MTMAIIYDVLFICLKACSTNPFLHPCTYLETVKTFTYLISCHQKIGLGIYTCV